MPCRPLLALAAILVFGLSLSACQPQRPQRALCPAGQRCLEYGNGGDPLTLDPQLATTVNEAAILRELFEGLYADGPDGAPVPGLAASQEVSADGLVWTFHLKPWRWSDGVPVTADDFVFAYRHMLDPKLGSSYAYLLYVLKNAQAVNAGKAPVETVGAEALDPQTLRLTLEHPAPFLPQILKHQAFFPIPAHLVRQAGSAWVNPGRMISDGPYKLVSWRLGDYVRVEKNPFFDGSDKLCFNRVDFNVTQDSVAAERRVLRGELDLNNAIQSNRYVKLKSSPQTAPFVHTHPYLSTSYIIFNIRDVQALKDVRVRQAISMAIDRQFITDKLLRAGEVPTTSFVPHGIAGYLPLSAPHPRPYWADWPFEKRQEEARRLMVEAGYGAGHRLKLEFKTTNRPGSLLYAQSIQADERAIGVDLTFRQEDTSVMFESFNIRDFQIGSTGWIADYDDPMTYLALMRSDTGQQNYGDYKNPAYDALLNAADHEADGAKRATLMAKAEQMMLDDANVAPIETDVDLNLVNPRVTGWVDNDSDIHPIRYLCRNDASSAGTKPAP
jgi:oligopeptide transport system substrate-binding protein